MNDETTKVFQNETVEKAENNDKARKVAMTAGVSAGAMGIGGVAGYATVHNRDEQVELPDTAEVASATETPAEPAPQVVERVVVKEVQAPAVEEPAHEEITYDVDHAEVEVIEVGSTGSGGYYATARMDNHNAVLVDGDGDGKVDVLGVDVNNNGQLEDNEVMDVSDRNISMHDLAVAAHPQPAPTPVVEPDPVQPTAHTDTVDPSEIQVTHVEYGVEMGDDTVNVATIDYRGHAGMAVDTDQDNQADIVAIDLNDNHRFEDGEYFDAQNSVPMNGNRSSGVNTVDPDPMPEPEPEPMPDTDTLPDYTNDGDVDGYII